VLRITCCQTTDILLLIICLCCFQNIIKVFARFDLSILRPFWSFGSLFSYSFYARCYTILFYYCLSVQCYNAIKSPECPCVRACVLLFLSYLLFLSFSFHFSFPFPLTFYIFFSFPLRFPLPFSLPFFPFSSFFLFPGSALAPNNWSTHWIQICHIDVQHSQLLSTCLSTFSAQLSHSHTFSAFCQHQSFVGSTCPHNLCLPRF